MSILFSKNHNAFGGTFTQEIILFEARWHIRSILLATHESYLLLIGYTWSFGYKISSNEVRYLWLSMKFLDEN